MVVPDLVSSPLWRDDRSAHSTIMYKSRSRRIPRNGNHRVLRHRVLRIYKSGAFSQNTAATSSRSLQVEPSSETPLGAPNVREKLSGSAAALFQRFGYVHVSIRDITSSIDIPKGTFYNHFESKEALASAILSRHFDALMEALGQSGSETAEPVSGGTSSPSHLRRESLECPHSSSSALCRRRVRRSPPLSYCRSPKVSASGTLRLRL